jgi:putative ABC transport system permease protein
VKPLDRKLFRDLLGIRGQVITIALVVACGISSYITMRTAYDSLLLARDRYYDEHRFSHVFSTLKRAPTAERARLETIAGVAEVETRIVEAVLVPMPKLARPASGTVVGIDGASTRQNKIYLQEGRTLDPNHPSEALVIEGFAKAHQLRPGDEIEVVLNGKLRPLRIVGVALSPEYVMTIAPGAMTYDPSLSPVLWVNQTALEAAFRLDGAFNSATFRLARDANLEAVLERIDGELSRYGGLGAVGRDKQISNFMLTGELTQLAAMAGFVPYLFLSVAALLVNVVLSRLVQLERSVIATLKALGYPDWRIGLYYLKLVSIIVVLGVLMGIGLGAWAGRAMMSMYTGQYFRFPQAEYYLAPSTIAFAVVVSLLSAVIGAWLSVRSIVDMQPAEAMQPPAPTRYKRSLLERLGLWSWLGPVPRMIWRELTRRPIRLVLSALGISASIGIVVVARSMWDSMEYLIDVQFHRSMREDLNVTFIRPAAPEVLSTLRHLPGVHYVEGLRSVPVRMRAGHRQRDSVLLGYPEAPRLRFLLDAETRAMPVPTDGVLLTSKLAEVLGIQPGERLTLELREGSFRTEVVTVAGTVDEPFGMQGHMDARALARLVRDSGAVNTALLTIDALALPEIERRLKAMPTVSSVASPRDFKKQFDEQSAAVVNTFTFIMMAFACVIAVGVVYNNARVSLSQRTRELGSLRVLGFNRREIASILFGEQAIQVVLSVPPGLLLGRWMAHAMFSGADPETYRMPVVVSVPTYVFAVLVATFAAIVSALLLRRKLDQLDLIGVLKTRE